MVEFTFLKNSLEEPGWRWLSLVGIGLLTANSSAHTQHTRTHHSFLMPQSQLLGYPTLSCSEFVCLFKFSLGPAWRWQHGFHDLIRSFGSWLPRFFLSPTPAFPTALGHKFERFFCIFKGSYTISCHPTLKSSNRKENVFVPSVRDRGTRDPRCPHFPSLHPLQAPHSNKNFHSPLNSSLICSLDKYIYICITCHDVCSYQEALLQKRSASNS